MFLSESSSARLTKTFTGSPEGVVTAKPGTVGTQTDAASAIDGIWYKKTGTGNTGWEHLDFGTAALIDIDIDGTLAANSDAKIATQKAVRTYVDAKLAGLSWKQAVRAATTAAGTLASSFENGDAIDGVTLATGDRILIKNQASGAENGIYTVNASGAPTRATDADSAAEMVQATVYVQEGTTLADTEWTCTTNAPLTLNTTALTFAQRGSGGGGATDLDGLSDVVITSPAVPQALGYDGSTFKNMGSLPKKLFDSTLGSDQASIDTGAAGVAGGYDVLEIFLLLRTTQAAATSQVNLRINNDSGNNYDRQFVRGVDTVASAATGAATAQWEVVVTGASATANVFGIIRITIPFYTQTVAQKVAEMTAGEVDVTAANRRAETQIMGWRNTAAITRFSVAANSGNLLTGSRMLIYGR